VAGRTLQSTIEIAGTLSPSLQQAIRQAIDRLEEMMLLPFYVAL
jgi:flavin-binding protein dodecin